MSPVCRPAGRRKIATNDLAKKEIVFDKLLNKYVIVEKIGNYATRTPIYLTPKEYQQYRLKRDMLQYFKDKVSATNSKKKGAKSAQKDLLPTPSSIREKPDN